MKGHKKGTPDPTDCETTTWVKGGCDIECNANFGNPNKNGAGMQTLTRSVALAPENGGVECPALE